MSHLVTVALNLSRSNLKLKPLPATVLSTGLHASLSRAHRYAYDSVLCLNKMATILGHANDTAHWNASVGMDVVQQQLATQWQVRGCQLGVLWHRVGLTRLDPRPACALFPLAGAPAAVKRADGGRPQVDTPNMWGSTKDGMTWTNIATAGISMLLAGTTNMGVSNGKTSCNAYYNRHTFYILANEMLF